MSDRTPILTTPSDICAAAVPAPAIAAATPKPRAANSLIMITPPALHRRSNFGKAGRRTTPKRTLSHLPGGEFMWNTSQRRR